MKARKKILLAIGIAIVVLAPLNVAALSKINPLEGIQYLHDQDKKSSVCVYAYAFVSAWRDLRTGYICDFSHNGRLIIWGCCQTVFKIIKDGHTCGVYGHGYTKRGAAWVDPWGSPGVTVAYARVP